jgi:hypothetical protein
VGSARSKGMRGVHVEGSSSWESALDGQGWRIGMMGAKSTMLGRGSSVPHLLLVRVHVAHVLHVKQGVVPNVFHGDTGGEVHVVDAEGGGGGHLDQAQVPDLGEQATKQRQRGWLGSAPPRTLARTATRPAVRACREAGAIAGRQWGNAGGYAPTMQTSARAWRCLRSRWAL